MELEILAKKEETERLSDNKAICYLCQTDLATYIRNLPEDFDNYTIQRSIEQNPYLDKLIETVLNRQHIPQLVLVANAKDLVIKGEGKELELHSFKILDGLQRTFRLNEINNAINFFYEELKQHPEFIYFNRPQINKLYKETKISTYLLFKVIEFYKKQKELISNYEYRSYEFSENNIQELKKLIPESIIAKIEPLIGCIYASNFELENELKSYLTDQEFLTHREQLMKSLQIIDFKSYLRNNTQWIEVWTNLSFPAQIDKMLILNAGHRQVSVKHQLELLFLNIIQQLNEIMHGANLEIVREKESSTMQYIHNRKLGQFHFSHLISGVLSFIEAYPITITSGEFNILQEKQDYYLDKMNFELLNGYMNLLRTLNNYVEMQSEVGIKWLAKEVVINGIFGALGDYQKVNKTNSTETFDMFSQILKSADNLFNIKNYNDATKKMNISGNIGKIYRDAIFNAIKELLQTKSQIDWNNHFQNN